MRWQQGGQPLELIVETRFPYDTHVRALFKAASPVRTTLRIRVPSWAAAPMTVTINGEQAGVGAPGSYLALHRRWSDGDVFEFILPLSLRIRPYNGEDQFVGIQRYSVEYGPILLAAVGNTTLDLDLTPEQLVAHLTPVAGSPLHFSLPQNLPRNAGQRFMPYWLVSQEEFTCFPGLKASA